MEQEALIRRENEKCRRLKGSNDKKETKRRKKRADWETRDVNERDERT